jgi:hypothetical protein
MSDTPSVLQDMVASVVFGFDDPDRKEAIRHLAREVGSVERELAEKNRQVEALAKKVADCDYCIFWAADNVECKRDDKKCWECMRDWSANEARKGRENPDPVCADCGSDLDGEGNCKLDCANEARKSKEGGAK